MTWQAPKPLKPAAGGLALYPEFSAAPDEDPVPALTALAAEGLGEEDRIVDGLFRLSRPISGSYFWCPPRSKRGLDLAALGL